jgi:hypothetical protein
MSTQQQTRFRPLTPADMEEYRKELEASQAAALEAAQNPESEDPATPESADPQTPLASTVTAEEIEELRQYKKRFADQTTFLNEQIRLRKEAEKARDEAAKQLQTPAQRFASQEEVANFEREVTTTPVLKQLMDDLAEQKIAKIREEMRNELQAEKSLSKKQVEDVAKLSKAHPDWREYDTGASMNEIFAKWLEIQPIRIQEMADYTATGDMDSAIAVLSMFKAQVQVKTGQTKKPTATNPSPSSKAELPAQKGGKFDLQKWDTDMDAAFKAGNKPLQNKLMADFEKARAEGRL